MYKIDSRLVKKGDVFVAIKGHNVDGHDYIFNAIKNGASKVIGEKDLVLNIPYEKVESTEEYLSDCLVKEYSNSINELKIIGITGTNGKTTSAYLIYQMLNELGKSACYIGTIGYFRNGYNQELNNTTPDILTLYNLLLDAKNNNIEYVVMEVSSHALTLERIKGIKLSIAVFTNLTIDHLDFHKTMDNYLNEKLKICSYLKDNGKILLNSDDENSKKFMKIYKNYSTFGINGNYKIIDYKTYPDHTYLEFLYNNKKYKVKTNLTGKFNIYNYLTCISVLNELGFSIVELLNKTKYIYPPKGRCETYKIKNAYVVIDYAHTPDAVEKVILSYKEFRKNKIITIIGCGGDRDSKKRPIMGSIATNNSDYVIFTNDNPRCEDEKKIMNDIIKGATKNNYEIIYDRSYAIKKGIELLKKNDILLVLGKGHENYQIIGNKKYHFDDAEIVKKNI